MRAHVGDRLVVGEDRIGRGGRRAVGRRRTAVHHQVAKGGHIAMVFPDQYARVIPAGEPAGTGGSGEHGMTPAGTGTGHAGTSPGTGRYALLTDGSTVLIRAAGPADAEAVRAMHAALSPDNLYLRFFSLSLRNAETEAVRVCREPGPGPRRVAGLARRSAGRGGQLRACPQVRHRRGRLCRARRHARPRDRHAAAGTPGVGRQAARTARVHGRDAAGEPGHARGVRRRRAAGAPADGRRRGRAHVPDPGRG